jgi:hypothetical protein
MSTDTSGMDEEVKAAHSLICDAIFQEMGIRQPASSSATCNLVRRKGATPGK